MKACCWLAALAALFAPVVALGDGDLVFETPWFDAGIAHYDSWPTDGSDKEVGGAGVWSSTQVARLVGSQDERLLSVSAPKGTNLLFTTETVRSVSSGGLSFRVAAKFTARETSTKLFLPSATAKCALTVAKITEGGAAAYFGLAKDPSGATNSWLRLYGAEPVFDTEIALSFNLRSDDDGNFVRYTAGETALEDGAGNEWLPVVFADGDAGMINEVGYSGDGEVRSLSGFVKAGQEVVRIPLTIPEIAHVGVKSVTANGFLVEPSGGVYLVPRGSVVVVRFSAEAGYAITATEMEFTAGDAAMDLPTEGRPEVVVNPKPTDWAGLFRWNMLEEIFMRAGGREAVAASTQATAYPDADGKFGDVDYTTVNNSLWAAVRGNSTWHIGGHFGHLIVLALANRLEEDSIRTAAIRRGYDYWLAYYNANKSKCTNWWWHQLELPRVTGYFAFAAEPYLTDAQKASALAAMKLAKDNLNSYVAWNRMLMAYDTVMRAVLAGDEKDYLDYTATIADQIVIVEADASYEGDVNVGLKPDYSYQMHAAQAQMGNYGAAIIEDGAEICRVLDGQPGQLSDEKMRILHDFGTEGYGWLLWKGMFDPASIGRGLKPDAGRNIAKDITLALTHTPGLELVDKRGYKLFDRSAFAIYRADRWMASIRMSTDRIHGVEQVNYDNLKGPCMADGALYFQMTGREYDNVYPLWQNWRLIPGITSYRDKTVTWNDSTLFANKRYKASAWTSDKTGYDGDTKTAATTYRFCREGLEFCKTWTRRADGNGLDVAVGGITSATDYEVVTCVENANARPGAGIVSQTDEQTVVRNGNVIYEINAPPNSVHVTVENREGDWHDIMGGLPSQKHSGRIFEVYVSHGVKPNNAEFTYSVKCAPVKKGLILFLQ